jgi:hypothetical protein
MGSYMREEKGKKDRQSSFSSLDLWCGRTDRRE